jgi:dihydropteroate synthase
MKTGLHDGAAAPARMIWQTARESLDLSAHGVVMGILNLTPDSFSDGGAFVEVERATGHALQMWADGAGIIDIGGESTRPGATPVPAAEEMRRVLPVIEALLAREPRCLISIDTSKAEVAAAALARGAAIVNDVTALRGDPAMGETVARAGAGVVLMHMQGTPQTMQDRPTYGDVVAEVREFLSTRFDAALAAGIAPECIALDPGIGFGKTPEHNLALLRHLGALRVGNCPLVLGVSRKGFLAGFAGASAAADRLWPTVALTALAREKGADVLRVHDVRPNLAALRVAEALRGTG